MYILKLLNYDNLNKFVLFYFQGLMFRGWYYFIDKIFGKIKYVLMKMMIVDQVCKYNIY